MDDVKRREWLKSAKTDAKVQAWLKKYPPPTQWRGTREEWAFEEMPQGIVGDIIEALFG